MNKKITALLLAAALTTGVGAYGTYAYFSDEAKVSENVNITMGKLDIEADWSGLWNVTSVGSEAEKKIGSGTTIPGGPKSNDLDYQFVKPGDYFTRKVTIKNIGNLNADAYVEMNNPYSDIFDLEIVPVDTNKVGNIIDQNGVKKFDIGNMNGAKRWFECGDSATVEVKLTVKHLNNDWQEFETGDINVEEFVKVYAEQLGADQLK